MKPFKWTNIQLRFISNNRTMPHAALAAAFNKRFKMNRSTDTVKSLCDRKKWRTGRTGCFEKGHKSWNKDTKGLTSANRSSFKKGNRPQNWLPVGSEIVTTDGYVKIKVGEPNKWKLKHLLTWEAEHGKVPPGKIVIFRDSDKLNTELDNLVLVNRPVLLRLNQNRYSETPIELKPAVLAVAELECKVFAMLKN